MAADRMAVMHFAGVARDDVTCAGFDRSAAACRALRSALDQAKPEGRVRVFAKVSIAVDARTEEPWPRRIEDLCGVTGA